MNLLLTGKVDVDGRVYEEVYLPYNSDDSDDTAIKNNFNEDMMKMIEGD
jgi:hypothetical protein